MKLATLHDGVLKREQYGMRAHRLSQAAKAGAPIPEAVVISDADKAIGDSIEFRRAIEGYVKKDQLYALRASPGRARWGGPYTIMALGMNDKVYKKQTALGDRVAAAELYRQAIATYAQAVMGLDAEPFDALLSHFGMYQTNANPDLRLKLLEATRALYQAETGDDFPQDPIEQLIGAVNSMARQWQAPTAQILRSAKGAPAGAHLSLIFQEMVHGLGSGNGVGRAQFVDPKTGQNDVNGIFVQATLTAAGANPNQHWPIRDHGDQPSLQKFLPSAYDQLLKLSKTVAKAISDAPELKFVLSDGTIYITEVLLARREGVAGLNILRQLVQDGILSETDALLRIDPNSIGGSLHPQIDPDAPRQILAQGVPASPGAATGQIAFTPKRVVQLAAKGERAILIRNETSPDDIRGMHAAAAVVTIRGGMTSHAAVIARGIGLPCVVGAQSLRLNLETERLLTSDGRELNEGEIITVDGTEGQILLGSPNMIPPMIGGSLDDILEWANQARRMRIRVNADTAEDARRALAFGAEGIGLCRTEHMFFAEGRLNLVRRLILSQNDTERQEIIRLLEPEQEQDFIELFEIMAGFPVTIRLLDPPLHEFLPSADDNLEEIAQALELDQKQLVRRIQSLTEVNPMLGMRGVRLGLLMPEIYEMQTRAIFSAAAKVNQTVDEPIVPEIMIPLVSTFREVEMIKERIANVATTVSQEQSIALPYRLGIMVETPRAALRSGDLARVTDFMSMGTNDLTQMTYGLSRDDAGRFMREYVQYGVLNEDPFLTIDIDGVGELIHEAARRGRQTNPDLLLGLCGEHGGDPRSIHFCEIQQFDYVSCSPFRVPIAQIAAAQATLLNQS